ncbi:GNAT family N-acetyltransferase [Nocardioides sp. zg-579]|uniref:Lysine N-acyltransferase MbtK n=1 Tax=Nocardioides marmotae TaxID=2663857 RepID=A0A6I3JB82_9ACTN|nr:GNAT family N-acetyltransferase [Nocardioides marmotae]MCR6031739.1 GNAT family N-acetyltransferase [Gordonia jinghuaiqii]MTB95378.1 GNAT family N-acetyltransferase [Nocardioides marmotae]QKE00826.1 GNAT family N-acetyltransferase [Nocardioides marmotae]
MSTPAVTLEPVDLDRDIGLLHRWVTHPRSAFWLMQGASVQDVAAEYAAIAEDPHHHAWLGRVDGEPAFLAETYDPARSAHSPIRDLPDLRPGDLGMHVLVAPPAGDPVPGFTRRVFGAVLDHCFADPGVRRVVVEPDARNDAIRAMNTAFGFRELRTVSLTTPVAKEAVLSVLDRPTPSASGQPTDLPAELAAAHLTAAHLTPEHLARAQRHLVTKALSELSHERLLAPTAVGDPAEGGFELTSPDGRARYTFRAQLLALEHWAVEPASIERTLDGVPAPLDVQDLVVELAPLLGIPDGLLPTYLEELAATLASAAWKLEHSTRSVEELLDLEGTEGYQAVEAAMTEGHPGFLANNGRIGFGVDDHAAYSPEAGAPVRLVWVAARREHTRLSLSADLTEEALWEAELDEATRVGFEKRLRDLGLDPDDYLYLPLHPWQWRAKVAVTFAPDVARRDLVPLGEGPDTYRAQQSIRTFFNTSRPERHYVKTALAVQNMGFLRGLSPAYMGPTPAINDWVAGLVDGDEELRACGFSVLRERAAIGYTGDAYHRLADRAGVRSPYQKMIAALWRESPLPRLREGERLATMAALLHRDGDGRAFVSALVERSGLPAREWVRRWLDAYVRPVAHCLVAHELAFMPHGENLVLVLRDHAVDRVLMKDVGEEVAVMDDQPLPPEVERVRADVPPDVRALALHTDVFDGVLRHVAAILHLDGVLDETVFWAEVRGCLERHRADHPELAERHAAYDLLRAEFRHSCLNRLQLRNTLQMVDLTDQSESLMYAGTLANPAADPAARPAVDPGVVDSGA